MTTMAEVAREGVVLAAAGRALLLQLAHPAIGRGVARHSRFAQDPLARLHGTLAYVYAVAAGTPEDVAAVRRVVDRAHAPVRGPGYSATDPELQLWVAATLYDSAVDIHARVFGPPGEPEALYREYARLGSALQMPEELWPADRAAFAGYWQAQLAALAVDDEVRAVQRMLLPERGRPAASLPGWLRPLLPGVRELTAHLLPAPVRELFAIEWSAGQDARVARRLERASALYRRLPPALRAAPQRHYLRRVRRLAAP
ncbi:MAG: oxygenase MpaB family protein [Microbacteriaceae bacterium]